MERVGGSRDGAEEEKRAFFVLCLLLAIIVIGLVPVVILSTFLANRMIEEYRKALRSNYEQAADYVAGSLETMLDTYNTASKMPYNYSYSIREGYVVKGLSLF